MFVGMGTKLGSMVKIFVHVINTCPGFSILELANYATCIHIDTGQVLLLQLHTQHAYSLTYWKSAENYLTSRCQTPKCSFNFLSLPPNDALSR